MNVALCNLTSLCHHKWPIMSLLGMRVGSVWPYTVNRPRLESINHSCCILCSVSVTKKLCRTSLIWHQRQWNFGFYVRVQTPVYCKRSWNVTRMLCGVCRLTVVCLIYCPAQLMARSNCGLLTAPRQCSVTSSLKAVSTETAGLKLW